MATGNALLLFEKLNQVTDGYYLAVHSEQVIADGLMKKEIVKKALHKTK